MKSNLASLCLITMTIFGSISGHAQEINQREPVKQYIDEEHYIDKEDETLHRWLVAERSLDSFGRPMSQFIGGLAGGAAGVALTDVSHTKRMKPALAEAKDIDSRQKLILEDATRPYYEKLRKINGSIATLKMNAQGEGRVNQQKLNGLLKQKELYEKKLKDVEVVVQTGVSKNAIHLTENELSELSPFSHLYQSSKISLKALENKVARLNARGEIKGVAGFIAGGAATIIPTGWIYDNFISDARVYEKMIEKKQREARRSDAFNSEAGTNTSGAAR